MTARYRLDLMGGCKLTDSTSGQTFDFRTRKAKCMIGLVTLAPEASMNREKIASYLWDPAPDEQARTSLRQCLKEVRDVLGEAADDILVADRMSVAVQIDNIEVDALSISRNISKAKTNVELALHLAKLWNGELFGDAVPPAPLFEAWVQVERSRYRGMVSNLLTDHLENQIKKTEFDVADLAEELLRIEPSHELAHQFLMKYYALRGDQAGALRQFTHLSQVLADELDSEPSQESVDLLVAIKGGEISTTSNMVRQRAPVPSARQGTTRNGMPKIAVRPPLSRHHDDSKNYLADGFASLTKICLAKFRSWVIVSWPSSGFESKVKIDYPALGNAIGVDYVVDLALDWRQPQGRLFVALVDCRDASEVWSDIFPIAENELQSMSSNVAGMIAAKLASQVNHITLLRFARTPPSNAAAYDIWLRGHQLSRLWSPEADVEAKSLFKQATEIDPGLACAYASLAAVMSTQAMIRPNYADVIADRKRALELSQTAVSLDPFDSRNHINMGWSWLLAASEGRAYSHFKLAAELNPHDSETLIASAMGMAFMGHMDLALEWSKSAMELNPVHPDYFLGYSGAILYLAKDYPAAAKALHRCSDIFPDRMAWVAATFAKLGDAERAIDAYNRFLEIVTTKWEGATPPTHQEIHTWMLFKSTPMTWKEGRLNLKDGLELAHQLSVGKDKN